MMKINLFLLFSLIANFAANAQFRFADSCVQFNLYIQVDNAYSDTITYLYHDCSAFTNREKLVLKNGKGLITGHINRANDMILFCDPEARTDDSSYYRMIVEPGNAYLHLTMTGRNITNDLITGNADGQNALKKWKTQNRVLLQAEEKYFNQYVTVLRNDHLPADTVERKKLLAEYLNKRNVLRECRCAIALEHIKQFPDSYSSAVLLYWYERNYPVDTLMNYFKLMSVRLQQSDLGKKILKESLTRATDWHAFAPYIDSVLWKKLVNLTTIYDVTLPGLQNENVSFVGFKNKIILLDFWGSWCAPCVQAIPSLNQLKADLKNLSVEIISVSEETDEISWKKAVEKYKFKTIHVLDKEGLLSSYFHVLGYPRYVLIDETGKIIDMNAPKPNDGVELKNKILELVQKMKEK